MNKIGRKGDRRGEKGKTEIQPYPNKNNLAIPKRESCHAQKNPKRKEAVIPKVKKHIMSESEGTAKRLERLLRD